MNIFSRAFKKFIDLVNKDIPYEDESKQVCVTIRVFELIMLLYFAIFIALSVIFWSGSWILPAVPWILLAAVCLACTYRFRTRTAFHIFSVCSCGSF